eukprot:scaffold98103_cov29-Tisochrysis_lutea.AAC.5
MCLCTACTSTSTRQGGALSVEGKAVYTSSHDDSAKPKSAQQQPQPPISMNDLHANSAQEYKGNSLPRMVDAAHMI